MDMSEYLELLLAGDDEACLAAARSQAGDLDGLHRLYVELIEPSQYRVGELWESGRISVAAEHLATAVNSYVASSCYASLADPNPGGPRAIITCTPGELHELGPRMFADLLECDGWDVDFHGTTTSVSHLIDTICERTPRFVGLSTALLMHLDDAAAMIASIRAALGDQAPPIVVGGNAYRGAADLWRQVGADFYAVDASAAVAVLRPLKGHEHRTPKQGVG